LLSRYRCVAACSIVGTGYPYYPPEAGGGAEDTDFPGPVAVVITGDGGVAAAPKVDPGDGTQRPEAGSGSEDAYVAAFISGSST